MMNGSSANDAADLSLWLDAIAVYRRFGDQSLAIADMRVETLAAEGDQFGRDVWCEIRNMLTLMAPRSQAGITWH